ncbi:unnamed protein product [Haemonchus placei]|uniref:Clathrin light chain n=1 Tax=Haemonchus placei TaxID=6290 RepID=A0A0N4W7G4_HAEPC|nr:unnamed protein product [Haemonchus placei]
MSVANIEIEEFNESFDDLLLDNDNEAFGGLDGDDMAPVGVSDTDDSDSGISDGDYDERAENIPMNDAQTYDRWAFSEPVGSSPEV